MAEVVVLESSAHSKYSFGRTQADVKMKRKTPSELRGEQLKRRNGAVAANEELASRLASERVNSGGIYGVWKPELSKNPKYINTCVDEVYPVKKSAESCRMLYGKENAKGPSTIIEVSADPTNVSLRSNISDKDKHLLTCDKIGTPGIPECSDRETKNQSTKGFWKIEKCSQSVLRDVVGLHMGNNNHGPSKVDMEKALKGLVACHDPASVSLPDSSEKIVGLHSESSGKFSTEFQIHGHRIPLDFTLKTSMRLFSSSTVKWCHNLSVNHGSIGSSRFSSQFCYQKDQNFGCEAGLSLPADVQYTNALTSWAFPQSSLPPSLISVMATSSVRGELDFLTSRRQDWEDAFQSLYYMLRKGLCNIFYVYTPQFVVLFMGGVLSAKKKDSCNAYLSQSTRGLRSLLRKHDICFSMPLCHAEVEEAAEDDLVELTEIEKRNLGQTFHIDSLSAVDNSPQSLLAFIGNKNVHSLYDFLLNYRHFLNSLAGVDVPVLFSPVPFQNSSLCIPKVRCKEMKRADLIDLSSGGSDTEATGAASCSLSSGVCYSIEIKDTILPPWIVCRLCVAMSSDGRSFESSFTTEPTSLGLNVALDSVCLDNQDQSNDCLPETQNAFGIAEAVLSRHLQSASLRRLKYANGSQVAYVDPLW